MMSSFGIGFKAIKAMCQSGTALNWYQAKIIPEMFKPGELPAYEWVREFISKHHTLPSVETLGNMFPDIVQFSTPEPPSYYVEHLENRLYYEKLNSSISQAHQHLKAEPGNPKPAVAMLQETLAFIKSQEYRVKLVNLVTEGPQMVLMAYHNLMNVENVGQFGWDYLDSSTGGMMPGDVVTFIGRPAAGKTWKVLYTAHHNWKTLKRRPLVVSMEMSPLPLIQRIVAMNAGTNISQLKLGGYSSQTYKKFAASLLTIAQAENPMYVVDGNLAASVEDIFTLAVQLKCDQVYIDGAYLCRHPNKRLDRYTRVAENAELIKQSTSNASMPTVASYQFSRTATKDKKKGDNTATLDDIAYSDVIGQVSTISLGLFQDDSVETIEGRVIRVLKGRNGEVGQFKIHWDFNTMDFSQMSDDEQNNQTTLDYI
jgi:replicative DNA helicase